MYIFNAVNSFMKLEKQLLLNSRSFLMKVTIIIPITIIKPILITTSHCIPMVAVIIVDEC